ncbi:phenylacetaldoxime dehydratase family protein [Candidatus Poriferisodalis sp.]|uniref:phenylacetaldoxime dehydratase family protein n=1 Tax=Candidatus Poriferisodalis sp. TaxID=3101277 RepID=UPI003B51CEA1
MGDPRPGNLCLIRSGQVWHYCEEQERSMYFDDVGPTCGWASVSSDAYESTEPLSGRTLRTGLPGNVHKLEELRR